MITLANDSISRTHNTYAAKYRMVRYLTERNLLLDHKQPGFSKHHLIQELKFVC